jgi:predicted O-methyltransferase YrrM
MSIKNDSLVRSALPPFMRRALRRLRESLNTKRNVLKRWWNRPYVYSTGTAGRIGAAFRFDTHLSSDERIMLYALVRGLRPERVLEIGTHQGASASIIAAALEDNGRGRIVGLDPHPNVTVPPRHFYNRFELVREPSPQGITEASKRAGGTFDFVHWDCIVIYDQAQRDLNALLPHLAESAYLLMNNPMHAGVHLAIRQMIEQHDHWHDCGYLCRQVVPVDGDPVAHRGLQLIRIDPVPIVDPRPHIERAFARRGLQMPDADPTLLNHDPWFCRAVKPCPWCQRQKTGRYEAAHSKETSESRQPQGAIQD